MTAVWVSSKHFQGLPHRREENQFNSDPNLPNWFVFITHLDVKAHDEKCFISSTHLYIPDFFSFEYGSWSNEQLNLTLQVIFKTFSHCVTAIKRKFVDEFFKTHQRFFFLIVTLLSYHDTLHLFLYWKTLLFLP